MNTRKGITPVVAIVLLIAIVVAGGGAMYSMVTASMEQAENPSDRLNINPSTVEFESCWGTQSDANFSIRNTGQSAINASEIPVSVNTTFLSLEDGDYNMNPSIVDPQQSFTLDLDSPTINDESKIALVLEGEAITYQCRNLS